MLSFENYTIYDQFQKPCMGSLLYVGEPYDMYFLGLV